MINLRNLKRQKKQALLEKCNKSVSRNGLDGSKIILRNISWARSGFQIVRIKRKITKNETLEKHHRKCKRRVMVSINVEKILDLQILKRKFQKKGCSYTKMNFYDDVMTCDA